MKLKLVKPWREVVAPYIAQDIGSSKLLSPKEIQGFNEKLQHLTNISVIAAHLIFNRPGVAGAVLQTAS